jgi:glycosyltransferase involved in cell wall biosynthesis
MNPSKDTTIAVQIIIPVHNASSTIIETVQSALRQQYVTLPNNLEIHVCCFDDGSTDNSWELLQSLLPSNGQSRNEDHSDERRIIPATLHLQRHDTSRGAGFARNRAVDLLASSSQQPTILCWLDADDLMVPTRVAEQVDSLLSLPQDEQPRTLLGCQFTRDPPTATWHYTQWANSLSEERLWLEQFREVTIIQPTWMMWKSRFHELGGYIEAPVDKDLPVHAMVDPASDNQQTLRLAEDLRFFYTHIQHDGLLKVVRKPLVIYRHVPGRSQSSATPRKLLLRIRVLAFSQFILRQAWNICSDDHPKNYFCIWGAGRDGKDFYKALTPELQACVYCFADVDDQKIIHIQKNMNIPIVHYSLLAHSAETRTQLHQAWCEQDESREGRIDKGRPSSSSSSIQTVTTESTEPPLKKQRLTYLANSKLDMALLSQIPVVVCVAMYRTNGALERNVQSIGRTEGKDLWFFH